MENKDFISIIIPVYNRPALVAECLDSILAQTNPNWECIVVDDGSTDNTWEVLESYAEKDERIKVFKRHREPKGAPTCRNIGAELANGDYFVFFDSDDILFPYAIEQKIIWMNSRPEVDCGVCQQINVNADDTVRLWFRSTKDISENYVIRLLTFQTAFSTPSVVWRRNSFFKSPRWDESLLSNQDPPLHALSILRGLQFAWMDILPSALIRQSSDDLQITIKSNFNNFINKLFEIIYQNNLPVDKIKTIRRHIKSKLYESSFFVNDYKIIVNLAQTCFIKPMFNVYEQKSYLFYFKIFYKSNKNIVISKILYKLGFIFYKKKISFVKSIPEKEDIDLIVKSINKITQAKYETFVNIPLVEDFYNIVNTKQ